MLFLLSLLFLAIAPAAAATAPWQDLLVYSCDGSAHLFPQHPVLRTGLNVSILNDAYVQLQSSMANRLSCACPGAQKSNIDITVGSLLTAYQARTASSSPPADCPSLQFYDSFLSHLPSAGLPTTCNGDSWKTSQSCNLIFPSPLFASTPASALTLQLSLKQCPNKPTNALPYMSLSCSGTACQDLFTPCSSDSDCKGGSSCTTVSSGLFNSMAGTINKLLIDTLHVLNPSATCQGTSAGGLLLQNLISTLYRQITGAGIFNTPNEVRMCGMNNLLYPTNSFRYLGFPTLRSFSVSNLLSLAQTYVSIGQVYAQQLLAYIEQRFSATVLGVDNNTPGKVIWNSPYALQDWNGNLQDGSSVTNPNRMSGSAFNNTRFNLSVSTSTTTPSTILVIENDARFGLFPNSPLSLTGYSGLLTLLSDVHGTFGQLATCASGTTLTSGNVQSWYDVTTPSFWLNALSHGTTNPNALPNGVSATSTPLNTVINNIPAIALPVTCTAPGFAIGGYCQAAYTAFFDLFKLGLRISVSAAPSDNQLPRIVADCYGDYCAGLLRPYLTKTCVSDNDCTGNGLMSSCYNLNSIQSPLSLASIMFSQPIGGNCESDITEVVDVINLIASYTHQPTPSFAYPDPGLCTVPYSSFFNGDAISAVSDAIVNQSPKSSTGVIQLYGLTYSADNMSYPMPSAVALTDDQKARTPYTALIVFASGCSALKSNAVAYKINLIKAFAEVTNSLVSQFSIPSAECLSGPTTQSHSMQRRLMQAAADSGVAANVLISPSTAAGAVYPANIVASIQAQINDQNSPLRKNQYLNSMQSITAQPLDELPPPTPVPSSSSGLSAGAIAGIVVGSVVGVALIAAAGTWFYLRHKRPGHTKNKVSHDNEVAMTA